MKKPRGTTLEIELTCGDWKWNHPVYIQIAYRDSDSLLEAMAARIWGLDV